MKTHIVVALAVTVLLGACATRGGETSGRGGTEEGVVSASFIAPVKCEVDVLIDSDEDIVVLHEPVHSRRCPSLAVTWRLLKLKPGGPVYAFDTPGVVFNKPPLPYPLPTCSAGTSAQYYKCVFSGRTGETSGYTIYLLKDGVPWKKLDPHMVND